MTKRYPTSAKIIAALTVVSALVWHSTSIANQAQINVSTELLWSVSGFDQPESTVYLPDANSFLVSNINGAPMELNGKGYISKVSQNGQLLERYWARGFDAPKGMGYFQGKVYVADMQQLLEIDSKTAEVTNRFIAAGSKMLNDIAIDSMGNVFVSDLIGGGVYRLENGNLNQWLDAKILPHPNGLTFDNNALTIASWGRGLKSDFTTDTLGSAYQLPQQAHTTQVLKESLKSMSQPIGNLDGIERFADIFITNDWINGKVFALKEGRSQVILEAGKGAADINIIEDQLIVPMMLDNRLDVYKLN